MNFNLVLASIVELAAGTYIGYLLWHKPAKGPKQHEGVVRIMYHTNVDRAPDPISIDLAGLTFADDKGNAIVNEKAVVALESDNPSVQIAMNPADASTITTGTVSYGPTPGVANCNGTVSDPASGKVLENFGFQVDVVTGAVSSAAGAVKVTLGDLVDDAV